MHTEVINHQKSYEVDAIMKLSRNWVDFKRKINRVYPKFGETLEISFDYGDEE